MAVEINEDVRDMVEQKLRANPDMSTKDLKLKAEEIDSDIEDLSVRQFNARYPLQVKRKLAAEEEEQDGGEPVEETEPSEEPEAESEAAEEEETEAEPDEDKRDQILAMIEEVLRENPDASNQELQERAAEIDSAVAELGARSFNARYPLQVKRKLSAEREEKREAEAAEAEPSADEPASEAPEADDLRPSVRQALLDFAKDIAGAEDRGKVIEVLTNVDEYVDRALEAE